MWCKPIKTPPEANLVVDRDGDKSDDSNLMNITKSQKFVAKLIYLTIMRLDVCYDISGSSQFMHKPRKTHMIIAFSLLIFLKNSIDKGVYY